MATQFWKIVVLGALAVVLFDCVASFASIWLGFPYTWATIGSVIIYASVGFLACRRSGFLLGVIAAALMGVVDSTLGWFVSWEIGAGAIPGQEFTLKLIANAMVFVVSLAAVSGLLGAAIGKFVRPKGRE